MTTDIILWLMLMLAVALSNWHWFNSKLCGLIALSPLWLVRLLNWLIGYIVWLIVSTFLEIFLSASRHTQDWEFYVATLCLYAIFSVPGLLLMMYRRRFRD